jgi:hypothetical protein
MPQKMWEDPWDGLVSEVKNARQGLRRSGLRYSVAGKGKAELNGVDLAYNTLK